MLKFWGYLTTTCALYVRSWLMQLIVFLHFSLIKTDMGVERVARLEGLSEAQISKALEDLVKVGASWRIICSDIVLATDVNKWTSWTFSVMLFCLHSVRSAVLRLLLKLLLAWENPCFWYVYLFVYMNRLFGSYCHNFF